MPIAWDSRPPDHSDEAPQPGRIRTVKAGERLSAILLGQPEGVWTHWVKSERRTRPCDGESCPHCKAGVEQQHAWYGCALLWEEKPDGSWHWVQGILSWTDGAHKAIVNRAQRGTLVELSRPPGAPNGPMAAHVKAAGLETVPYAGRANSNEPLPDPEDVRAALMRAWGRRAEDDSEGRQDVLPLRHRKSG